jgi:GNAT superfamily N-acetyltransferase
MKQVQFPAGWRVERLCREHPRRKFKSGHPQIDRWLKAQALQHQEKHLSVTKTLLDDNGAIAGFYTLASGEVDFGDLPLDISKRLPRRNLPVVVLAWLGVCQERQRQGLGERLLAQALRDCWEAGKIFAFVAVILDCLDVSMKRFYQQWGFEELPGRPYRLYLSAQRLGAMMGEEA